MVSFGSASGPQAISPDSVDAAIAGMAVAPKIIPFSVNRTVLGGLIFTFGHKITTTVGTVDVAAQEAEPTKPADQAVSFSTYGVVIPISMGKRVLSGNVVQCSPIQSRMLPLPYTYYIDYQVPITTTDEVQGGLTAGTNIDDSAGLDLNETGSELQTDRIFQNNDDTSDNWVDVQSYKTITLINNQGESRTYRFQVSE